MMIGMSFIFTIFIMCCLHPLLACPVGWTEFSGSCYALFRESMVVNITSVRALCRRHGADILRVTSDAELTAVFTIPGHNPSNRISFIDLTDNDVEGDWRHLDGTPGTYFNWRAGEPYNDQGTENCVLALGHEFNDVSCFPNNTGTPVVVCEMSKAEYNIQAMDQMKTTHFTTTRNARLQYFEILTTSATSQIRCARLCHSQISHQCVSFNYNRNTRFDNCVLNQGVSSELRGSLTTGENGWDYYQMNN